MRLRPSGDVTFRFVAFGIVATASALVVVPGRLPTPRGHDRNTHGWGGVSLPPPQPVPLVPHWHRSTGTLIRPPVQSVAFGPGVAGGRLAAGHGSTVHVLASSGALIWRADGGGNVRRVAFGGGDGSGGGIVAVGVESRGVVVFDAETGEVLHEEPLGNRTVHSVALQPGGKRLAYGDDHNYVGLIDLDSGEFEWRRELGPWGPWVLGLAFSADGERIVAGSLDRKVTMMQVGTGETLWTATTDWSVNCVAFHPHGKYVVVADNMLRLLDATSGSVMWVKELSHKKAWINGLAFSPDGDALIAGRADYQVTMLNASSGEFLWTRPVGWGVYSVSVAAAPSPVADSKLQVVAGGNGEMMALLNGDTGAISWVQDVAFCDVYDRLDLAAAGASAICSNNLGGHGPDRGAPPELRYSRVGLVAGRHVDLVVRATKNKYDPAAPRHNGLFARRSPSSGGRDVDRLGGVGVVDVRPGSTAELNFTLVASRSDELVQAGEFFLTVLFPHRGAAQLWAEGFHKQYVSDSTDLVVTWPPKAAAKGGGVSYQAPEGVAARFGNKDRAVTFLYKDRSSFLLKFQGSSSNEGLMFSTSPWLACAS